MASTYQSWVKNQIFISKQFVTDQKVSTANPWLDFLTPDEAISISKKLNEDLEEYCATGPDLNSSPTLKRLYGLGMLPLVPTVSTKSVLDEIDRIAALPHLRGVIMGTRGVGKGLDDG